MESARASSGIQHLFIYCIDYAQLWSLLSAGREDAVYSLVLGERQELVSQGQCPPHLPAVIALSLYPGDPMCPEQFLGFLLRV